jgi:hypothetical protein
MWDKEEKTKDMALMGKSSEIHVELVDNEDMHELRIEAGAIPYQILDRIQFSAN